MLENFNIQIYIDGPDFNHITDLDSSQFIKGFTFNPSLMRKAGVVDYLKFTENILHLTNKPCSFEVIADEPKELIRQAKKISKLANNVYVKVPIVYTNGSSTFREIEELSRNGIKLNVTAIFTANQTASIEPVLNRDISSIVSVFAGRIADAGVNPEGIMEDCRWILEPNKKANLLWASCREVYNVIQAENCGCDIITITESILDKLHLVGKNLEEYSKETVLMFYNDAKASNYQL